MVGDLRVVREASEQEAPVADLGLDLLGGLRRGRAAPDEVRARGRHVPALLAQRRGEAVARRGEAAGVGLHPLRVGERGLGERLREGVDVVGVLDLVERLDHRRGADEDADAQAGERPGLGERARDDDVRLLQREPEAVLAREGGVGLVDQQGRGREGASERAHGVNAEHRPRRGVGVHEAEEVRAGLRRAQRGERGVVRRQGDGDERRLADLGEDGVEGVRGLEDADRRGVADEDFDREAEDLVGPVPHEDAVGLAAVAAGEAVAEAVEGRVGIEAEARRVEVAQRLLHLRGGRVGVLVGVELDDAPELRLLAGDVGGQGLDGGADHVG